MPSEWELRAVNAKGSPPGKTGACRRVIFQLIRKWITSDRGEMHEQKSRAGDEYSI